MIPRAISRAFMVPLSATALIFAGVSDLRAAPAADPNTIVVKNFDFSPMSLTVPAGTTVIWLNLDGEPHTVVSVEGLFRSGGLDQNDTFSFTFDKAGTYQFVCSIHPQMRGTIVVK
jgi:plastocyanin